MVECFAYNEKVNGSSPLLLSMNFKGIKISKIYDSKIYHNYSKILLQWKIEPIALVITIFTYQEPMLALKVYSTVALLIHMPGVFYRAFKKISK